MRVPGGADAVVAEAVEKYYGIVVGAVRTDDPGMESHGVGRGDGNVGEV